MGNEGVSSQVVRVVSSHKERISKCLPPPHTDAFFMCFVAIRRDASMYEYVPI